MTDEQWLHTVNNDIFSFSPEWPVSNYQRYQRYVMFCFILCFFSFSGMVHHDHDHPSPTSASTHPAHGPHGFPRVSMGFPGGCGDVATHRTSEMICPKGDLANLIPTFPWRSQIGCMELRIHVIHWIRLVCAFSKDDLTWHHVIVSACNSVHICMYIYIYILSVYLSNNDHCNNQTIMCYIYLYVYVYIYIQIFVYLIDILIGHV